MLFILRYKRSFHPRDIQVFVLPSSPLFPPLVTAEFLEADLWHPKVYDIIMCLHWNVKTDSLISRKVDKVWYWKLVNW